MSALHLNPPQNSKEKPAASKTSEVVDSWEDEDASSPIEDDVGTETPTDLSSLTLSPSKSDDSALPPPPPTPISPRGGSQYVDWSTARVLGGGRPTPYSPSSTPSDSDRERKRPEKTTATASRMIAAGLGLKAPKKSEETKQYERAVRDQEIKRKNREKEMRQREQEADEKLKAAVWDS